LQAESGRYVTVSLNGHPETSSNIPIPLHTQKKAGTDIAEVLNCQFESGINIPIGLNG
jgi:hypothetical protein